MLTKSLLAGLAGLALTGAVPASHLGRIEARQVTGPFALQTKVIPGIDDCGSNKDGLYVVSYHTGAGLGVAALATDEETFYRNETDSSVYYEYPSSIGPWPIAVEYGPYQAYNPLSISVASSDPPAGLFFNASGLQYNETFGGWLACDSWYKYPQLFIINGPDNGPLPKSCSLVQLQQVPATSS